VGVRLGRRIAVVCGTVAALALWPGAAGAQARVVESVNWKSDEGLLIAYYSAAIAFSPVAAPRAGAPWATDAGLELSYIPELSEAQRSGNFQKTESTNLVPVLPRPRALVALPGEVTLEASWVPPIKAFDVTANLFSVALARPTQVGAVMLTPRVSGQTGYVTGPITCSTDLKTRSENDAIYYTYVCHDVESEDRFEPRVVSGELVASRSVGRAAGGAIVPYVGGGIRTERTRFKVGVRNADGSTDPNHPIFELRLTRGYGFAGATWLAGATGRTAVSTELFYAPGSVFTVRAQATLRLWGGR
jgi:hypothetical protein